MKLIKALAAFFALSCPLLGQTITSTTGSIQVGMQDAAGGSYTLTIPLSAASVVYTPPVPPTPPAITSITTSCPTSVNTGASAQCTATVNGTGDFNGDVVWSATSGTVNSGMFTAPTSAGTSMITATSVQDSTKASTVAIAVSAPSNGAPTIPANALVSDLVNPTTAWKTCVHDAGTPGTATCSNNYPVTGIYPDDARSFAMTYTGGGGVRWADTIAKDTVSTNFVYDVVVQSPDWSHIANLELDTNQVKANGHTTILGTQCSVYSHKWEITVIGTGFSNWHWVATNVPCNTPTWTPNVAHHIRIFGSISSSEVSTYIGVEFDGTYAAFTNAPSNTGEALGWGVGTVLENFQIDGLGSSGAGTIYVDSYKIYRW